MKPCPACGEQIQDVAVKCRFCGEILDPALKRKRRSETGPPWWKKILFGAVWWFALFFVGRIVVGAVAGGMAGAEHPNDAQAAARAGAEAGQRALSQYGAYILIGSVVVACAGAGFGVLPGTRGD